VSRTRELVVFDWDGTLMDSAAKIVRSFERALAEAGAPPRPVEAIRHVIGLGLAEAVQALLPEADERLRARVMERYREHFLHGDDTAMALFPGVREGLEALAERGYLLAVATGKSRRGLERVLAETGLGGLFAATRCADEAPSKPHPRMLEDILAYTGCEAAQAVMVGDTVYDMQMARAVGMDALAVSYGVHDRGMLLACGPLACFDSFPEVCAWLLAEPARHAAVGVAGAKAL
jgi:phosphoglycolate phosphatase